MMERSLYRLFKMAFALLFLVSLVTISACGSEKPEESQKQKPVAKAKQPAKQAQKKKETMEAQEKQAEKTVWPFSFEKEIKGKVRPVTVADKMVTRNFVVIFDDSGSMDNKDSDGNRKIDTAKNAVVEWSQSVPNGANVGLVSFHSGVWPLQTLNPGSKQELISTVRNIKHGGGTPLSEAFKISFLMLTKQSLQQLGYGEYTMVVITDGKADDASLLKRWVHFVLGSSPVQIYTIGFGIGTDHTLNQPGMTQYKPAENLAELSKGLKEVLAESETFDETEFK